MLQSTLRAHSSRVSHVAGCVQTAVRHAHTHAMGPMKDACGMPEVPPVSRSYYPRDELLQESIIPTRHYQPSMPILPLPKLDNTLNKYLNSLKPLLTDTEFAATKANVEDFRTGVGADLHDELVQADERNSALPPSEQTSFIAGPWYDMYLHDRNSVVVNSNPFLAFNDDPNPLGRDQSYRASALVHSALKFVRSYRSDNLEPDVFHMNPKVTKGETFQKMMATIPDNSSYDQGWYMVPSGTPWYVAVANNAYPLDMSQYTRLFGTCRIPRTGKDELRTEQRTTHVVFIRQGNYYSVDMEHANGRLRTRGEIQGIIQSIIGNSKPVDAADEVGYLTSQDREPWADTYTRLESNNRNTLDKIETALFTVCLDDNAPTDPTALSHQMLWGRGRDRWFDKSFNIIVTENGKSAVHFEHAWGDGVAVLRFATDVHNDSLTPYRGGAVACPKHLQPQPLKWNLSDDIRADVITARARLNEVGQRLDLVAHLTDVVGKDTFKKFGLSPDGCVQMSYQLAHHKMHNKFGSTYESASTAAFKHGRTETIRPLTPEAAAFVNVFKNKASQPSERRNALTAAVNAHSAQVKDCAMGQGMDRHMFALKDLATKHGNTLHPIFTDGSYAKLNHIILSTSTLSSTVLSAGGFGPVSPDGYGIGYMAADAGVGFSITSYDRDTAGLIKHIEESLLDLKTALEKSN